MPSFLQIPSTYAPERLDLLRQLEKVKQMTASDMDSDEEVDEAKWSGAVQIYVQLAELDILPGLVKTGLALFSAFWKFFVDAKFIREELGIEKFVPRVRHSG